MSAPRRGRKARLAKLQRAAVGDDDVGPAQDAAQQGKEARLAGFPPAMSGAQEGAAAQAEDAHELDERPAAAGFLGLGLGPLPLVVAGVRGGEGGAIDHEHAPPVAARQSGRRRGEPVPSPPPEPAQPVQRQAGAGRAERTAARVGPVALAPLPPRLNGSLGLAAG